MIRYNLLKGNIALTMVLVLCVFLLGGCCCFCFNIGDLGKEEFKRTETLQTAFEAGSKLIVETNVGSITVTTTDVNECNVIVDILVKAPEKIEAQEIAEQIEISFEKTDQALIIKADKPAVDKKRVICISYKIAVPKQTALELETNIGEITISDITEKIEARTNVGSVVCKQISGDVELSTDVGKIYVEYLKTASPKINASVSVDVGNITFIAPVNLSATISARSDVGSINTSLPLTVKGTIGKSLRGTIGKGEGDIQLRTDVGTIKIR